VGLIMDFIMDFKLVAIILSVLLIPPLMSIGVLSILGTIQPTIAGYDILTLMKINEYMIIPIIYIASILLFIFKYKVVFDQRTAFVILVLGLILLPLVFIGFKQLLVTSLFPTPMGINIVMEYNTLFRNQIFVSVCYLSFVFSIFLSQFSKKPLFKALIFVLGGLALSLVFSYLEVFIYSLAA
jgi:hypothetical protein